MAFSLRPTDPKGPSGSEPATSGVSNRASHSTAWRPCWPVRLSRRSVRGSRGAVQGSPPGRTALGHPGGAPTQTDPAHSSQQAHLPEHCRRNENDRFAPLAGGEAVGRPAAESAARGVAQQGMSIGDEGLRLSHAISARLASPPRAVRPATRAAACWRREPLRPRRRSRVPDLPARSRSSPLRCVPGPHRRSSAHSRSSGRASR